jgi:hypothetical protein
MNSEKIKRLYWLWKNLSLRNKKIISMNVEYIKSLFDIIIPIKLKDKEQIILSDDNDRWIILENHHTDGIKSMFTYNYLRKLNDKEARLYKIYKIENDWKLIKSCVKKYNENRNLISKYEFRIKEFLEKEISSCIILEKKITDTIVVISIDGNEMILKRNNNGYIIQKEINIEQIIKI